MPADAGSHLRRERRLLGALAALAAAFMLCDSALHLCDGTMHLLPFFLLLAPLLLGRYVGEDFLARMRSVVRSRRRRTTPPRVARRPAVDERVVRGVLLGLGLASRPPPAAP
jgi:hypothetical protein